MGTNEDLGHFWRTASRDIRISQVSRQLFYLRVCEKNAELGSLHFICPKPSRPSAILARSDPRGNARKILAVHWSFEQRTRHQPRVQGKLEKVVMVMFKKDSMVVPKQSAHFGYYIPGQDQEVESLFESRLYKEDRLGLKALNDTGR